MRRSSALLLLIGLMTTLMAGRPVRAAVHDPIAVRSAAGAAPPQVSAPAAILMDWKTGDILWERHALQRRDPASTTKIMTAVLTLERAKLSDTVVVSRRAAGTAGSSMYLRQGQRISVHDLLVGLLMRSGNDAAVALAEHVAGSVEEFAVLMNERARALGLKDSQFRNPHGLTEAGHYATAYDLALLTRHAMRLPTFAEMVAARERDLVIDQVKVKKTVQLRNTNALLWMFSGADGVKTGTTSAAGACLVGSATRGEQRLISVVLHAGNRWRDSANLLEWGYNNFRLVDMVHKGEVLRDIVVAGGRERTVQLVAEADLSVVTPKGEGEAPHLELEVPGPVTAPLKRGAQVGRVVVRVRNEVRATVPVVVAGDVASQTTVGRVLDVLMTPIRWLMDRNIPLS